MIVIRRILRRVGAVETVHTGKAAEEEAARQERLRLEADYERTHPAQVDRISGCCDRVDVGLH